MSSHGCLTGERLSLVLCSSDCLLREKEKCTLEFLIPLPGKILPSPAQQNTYWTVRLITLFINGLNPEILTTPVGTLLLLSRTLAKEQAVGHRYLPVVDVLHYTLAEDIITLLTASPHHSVTTLADSCHADTVDLSLTDLHGNPLSARGAEDLNTSVACTVQLILKKNW